MDRFPITPTRRRRWEAVIRGIDLVAYFVIFAGGIYALVFTPGSVVEELNGWEWLIYLWAALLLVGGVVGFIGRLLRRWFFESPATVLAFFGVMIYFLILSKFAFESVTATTATVLVFVAGLLMVRRYAELRIYGSEPGEQTFAERMAEAWERRTADAVEHR